MQNDADYSRSYWRITARAESGTLETLPMLRLSWCRNSPRAKKITGAVLHLSSKFLVDLARTGVDIEAIR